MKKQKEQLTIDLDSFDDVSLYQLIPSGRGMGQSLLKTIVDSVHNGNAKLNSLLIAGKEGLQTHSSAFIRAMGFETFDQIDGSLLQHISGLHNFFCGEENEAHIISNIEKLPHVAQLHVSNILKKKKFCPYNYLKEGQDIFDVCGLVVMTSREIKKIPEPVLDAIDHIVQLEDYTPQQLELIVLQRCKYAHVEIENDNILKDIVKYGRNNLKQSIRFLKTCIAVMLAGGRRELLQEDVLKATRLSRSPVPPPPLPPSVDENIPF